MVGYQFVHIFSLIVISFGLGMIVLEAVPSKKRKLGFALHGIGMLMLLVAGFGMASRLGMPSPASWPAWLLIKLLIWVILGLLPIVFKKIQCVYSVTLIFLVVVLTPLILVFWPF